MRGESDLSKCDSANSESPNTAALSNECSIPQGVSTPSGAPCLFMPLSFQNSELSRGSE